MLRDSVDPQVKSALPVIITGRKWDAKYAVETAESSLKMKEVIGPVATERVGLSLQPQRRWSKETTKNKRRMFSEEIHHFEENKRLVIAWAQPKQGARTKKENTKDRTIKWSNIEQMEPKQLSFLNKAVYFILPTPVNLKFGGLSTSNLCKAYGKIANLKHVLTGYQHFLRSYTWRHNEILGIIPKIAKMCYETANKISCIKTSTQFIKEGNISKIPQRNRRKPTLLDGCMDWRVIPVVDRQLAFPTELTSTRQRSDLVIRSVNSKKVIIAELTIPFEVNIDWAHQCKLEKYENLREYCVKNGCSPDTFPREIGCRGFISNSTSIFFTKLGLSLVEKREYIKKKDPKQDYNCI